MDTGVDGTATVAVTGVSTPSLFTGPPGSPLQVIRVRVRRERSVGPLLIGVDGPRVTTPHPRLMRADAPDAAPAEDVFEVSVRTDGAAPGERLPATVRVTAPDGRLLARRSVEVPVAEPGWTVRLVPHFHYDPMWWNTQAAYTSQWDAPLRDGEAERGWEYTGVPAFTLVPLHLQQARDDPAYRFVLSEIDYLKPFWDSHPEHRDEIRQLFAEGRVEIVGGTYNEPSTNLTGAESTVRSAQHGLGFHRAVLGAGPRTAWQLDVFGHDPSFPALMAGAGLDSAVLARGPHHQWGPMTDTWGAEFRPPTAMQLPAEYEWIGPGGDGLLLHYLPAHYSAGWFSHRAAGAEAAAEELLALFELLRLSAATRNVLIPMGTDFSWPHPWGLRVQREWNSRYTWPKLEHTGPREHFAAVRAELAARGEQPLPVTREMGPVYTGKDVTYADVKQAHRAAENLVQQAETYASLTYALGLGPYPRTALDKAWRHLLHAAHHDAVTGTFSDQVYLDLLPTWREAHELAEEARDSALTALADAVDTRRPGDGGGVAVTVFNPLSWARTDLVRADVEPAGADPESIALLDEAGESVPVLVESVSGDGTARIAFLASDVPGIGHRTWWITTGTDSRHGGREGSGGWEAVPGVSVRNERYEVEADPARGGGLCRVTDLRTGRELLADGEVDELVVQDEYAEHPFFEEGPWHLLPKGPGEGSAASPATSVVAERSPLGMRLLATGRTGPLAWTRTTTLWNGLDRVELTTQVNEFTGSDQLVRLRLPVDVPGALPVAETAAAAVGRGFGFPDADTGADHTRAPWTLDTPCLNWFALSSTARAVLSGPGGEPVGERPLGAGEIVLPDAGQPAGLRDLVTSLGRLGVTATPTRPGGPRWGDLAVDSSLPDFRLALGGPEHNAFTAAVLAAADPAYARAVRAGTHPVVWVPAERPLREKWQPGCDLTGLRDLPVAVVVGPVAELTAVVDGIGRTGRVEALHPMPADGSQDHAGFDDRTVALLVRGTPGFVVDTRGRLHSSLMRSCTGRPSGEWMDPPRRTAPDGSSFQLQHWTHVFEHALVAGAGDWRDNDLVRRGREFNTPLTAVTAAAGPGPLPATGSLLTVEPAERLLIEAVSRAPDGGLSVRVRETHGRVAEGELSTVVALRSAASADLLDVPGAPLAVAPDGSVPVTLGGNGYSTVLLTPAAPGLPPPRPEREALQPYFSRYWLHNTGTAPLGDAPCSVAVTPAALRAEGEPLCVTVTFASSSAAAEADVDVIAPDGWQVSWRRKRSGLPPGGHVRHPLTVYVPDTADPGDHLVRIVATTQDGSIEDCLTVTVPGAAGAPPGIEVTAPDGPLKVAAGESAQLRVEIGNTLRSPLRGEALLVSPYGGWRSAGPRSRVVDVPAGGSVEAAFDVRPPADTPPGTYWALVKAVCRGRVAYGPAVAVHITAPVPAARGEDRAPR
ncbi:MAG TPA: NEW3 domain-containing protein [Streptomyces sp.]|nr:NEW3 domain-containing protein [Streptomyces sp.]